MRTQFSEAQLADPDIAVADTILRKCVHCGFCTATCPTYVLLGDELDSPRGRISLIKDMLEHDRPPTVEVVKHIDRCLSCLACMTTCPSGVNYMHLIDQARVRVERDYIRPISERLLRAALAWLLPSPRRVRVSLRLGALVRPFTRLLPRRSTRDVSPSLWDRLWAMLDMTPASLPPKTLQQPSVVAAQGERRGRVALLQGCAQQVLAPEINAAAIRLLTRHGIEVALVADEVCCGALTHHLGHEDDACAKARANIDAWLTEAERGGLDAIVVTTSGCGTVIKDYGFMLRSDPAYAAKAERIAGLARDITEYISGLDLAWPRERSELVVAYHSACSLQHGQKIVTAPKELLSKCGFVVKDVAEAHLCCGSAGTYNLMQPVIANQLRDRKVANIVCVDPDVVAAGNIGCIMQIDKGMQNSAKTAIKTVTGGAVPVLHTVELLDWATGGPKPAKLQLDRLPSNRLPSNRLGSNRLGPDGPRPS